MLLAYLPLVSILGLETLAAQAPALKDVHRVLPAFRDYGSIHALGDVTGDGVPDVLFRRGVLWRGSPEGVFTSVDAALPAWPERCRRMILVDVDGDGDLDCVTANEAAQAFPAPGFLGEDRVFLNDGSGQFTESPFGPLPGSSQPSTDVAAADLDGDGDQDLVVTRLGQNLVQVNDGSGQFSVDAARFGAFGTVTNALALRDFDGDGDADVYFGNAPSTGADQLFVNDGLGGFTLSPLPGLTNNDETLDVNAADFDGDGDPDLLVRESLFPTGQRLRCLRNDGSGGFSAAAAMPPIPSTVSQLLLGDWNADGSTDYAVRNGGLVQTFVAAGAGSFQPGTLPIVATGDRQTIVLDYEYDGDSDLLAPSAYLSGPFGTTAGALDGWLLRNRGTGWSALPNSSLPGQPFGSGVRQKLADVDGDGNLDVVWSPYETIGGTVHLGDGTGIQFHAVPTGDFALDRARTTDIVFGDVDGDGDLDIVCANRDEPYFINPTSRLYRNDGGGSFSLMPLPPVHADQAALADFDGDGDLDILFDGFLQDHLLANDGTGTFQVVAGAVPNGIELIRPLQVADFDGDGAPDVGTYRVINQATTGVLINDGSGNLSAVPIPGLPHGPALALDFDGDLDVDLLTRALLSSGPYQLHRNDGSGGFQSPPVALPATGSSSLQRLVAIDVDNDGLPDLAEVTCPQCGDPRSVLRHNIGNGVFVTLADGLQYWPDDVRDIGVGDLDGDGDQDLLAATWRGSVFSRNLHHQIAWHSLPRVGYPLVLDLFGRSNEPYALALALARIRLPIPGLGTLHLDPSSLLVVAGGSYDVDGHAAFAILVPNDPGLVGFSVSWQALSGAAPPRLGNLEVTTFQSR